VESEAGNAEIVVLIFGIPAPLDEMQLKAAEVFRAISGAALG